MYANELADWELSSNKRINNFCFKKFRIAPSAILEFPSWWEGLFRKMLSQPPNTLLLKLKHQGVSTLASQLSPPFNKETIGPSAPTRVVVAKEASIAKSKCLAYLPTPTPFIIGCMTNYLFFLVETFKKSKGVEAI